MPSKQATFSPVRFSMTSTKGRSLTQAVVRTRVEPGKATAEDLHLQLAVVQELLVHRGDFQLATCRRLDIFGHIDDLVGIEIQSHHGVVALRLLGLFLDAEAVAVFIKFGHAVTLGVAHPIAEHGGFFVLFSILHGVSQKGSEAVAVEDVVAQNEASAIIADELLPDDESLCEAVGRGLFGILEMHTIVGAVAKQTLEAGQVVWVLK